ncbi:MAG: META domain-containing protein, partial [Clostridium sp.]|nr:META domain-containing protein [Clostridium sp.]
FEGEEVDCIDTPCLIFSKEDGKLYGSTGVNRFFGTYNLDGPKLQLGAVGATKMAGPEKDMEFEQEFLSAMGRALTVKGNGNGRLLLCDEDGNVVMELVKSEEE